MSVPIIDNSSVYNELQFGIRRNPTVIAPSLRGFETVARLRPVMLGSEPMTMTSVQAMNPLIEVSPPPGPVVSYSLPTSNALLSEFGRNLDTGVSNVRVGDSLLYRVVNIDNGTALITASTGGSGGPISCNTKKTSAFVLRFDTVNSSISGTTGTYTIYGV